VKLRHARTLLGAGAVLASLAVSEAAEPLPARVEIITNGAHPVATGALARRRLTFVYDDLDAPAALSAELGRALPADREAARRLVLARLHDGGEALTARVHESFQGLLRARAYGIDRIPAIVLDGALIVYGVSDTGEALERFEAWQAGQRP
jgi:integrating conjugative element protein (TIGR03757 family)